MSGKLILSLVASIVVFSAPGLADNAVHQEKSPLLQAVSETDAAETRELFLRCCWARGRAGFQYCAQYGVCKSDPEASCQGIGAADGMTASCRIEPSDLPEDGG